jgi:polyisoprenoid-binding protein YceI
MKTTNLLLTIAASGSLFLASCGESHDHANEGEATAETTEEAVVETTDASIDAATSSVSWTGEMMGMYSHNGTVVVKEANVSMAGDKVAGGSFVVDLGSITPLDENYDLANGNTPEKLVGHLGSADFFDVANHPTASFEITEVAEDGSSAKGNLTVRGITNEETVENITLDDGTLSGTLTFDRTRYDVAFTHPVKEMVLSNDIALEIALKVAG